MYPAAMEQESAQGASTKPERFSTSLWRRRPKLFAAKRLAAVEQDRTAYEVCQRIKRFAREYETDPEVLGLVDAVVAPLGTDLLRQHLVPY